MHSSSSLYSVQYTDLIDTVGENIIGASKIKNNFWCIIGLSPTPLLPSPHFVIVFNLYIFWGVFTLVYSFFSVFLPI